MEKRNRRGGDPWPERAAGGNRSGPGWMEKFLEDAKYVYDHWEEVRIDGFDTKILDRGSGPVLFQTPIARHLEPFGVPILKHLETHRRVITYERREDATR